MTGSGLEVGKALSAKIRASAFDIDWWQVLSQRCLLENPESRTSAGPLAIHAVGAVDNYGRWEFLSKVP